MRWSNVKETKAETIRHKRDKFEKSEVQAARMTDEVNRMDVSKQKTIALWELGLIAGTRGAIGFGAGLLLADKFKKQSRKLIGWSFFLTGLASTIPIAAHVFGRGQAHAGEI